MHIPKVIIAGFLSFSFNQGFSQTQHNFDMVPENTDCHELTLGDDLSKNISMIRQTHYRVKEQMNVSRYKDPKKVEFYSCDGKTGHMIAIELEKEVLYKSVKKVTWDSLLDSSDPIYFYEQNFKN